MCERVLAVLCPLDESARMSLARSLERITKGIGAPGDVLLSHKGTVGKVALVPDEAPAFVCSPQTTFWRTRNENRLDRKYLYAFLRSPGFHAQLATRAGETDMAPYVSLTSQRGLTVVLPPIDEQRAIAHIIGTLDEKIELNRCMNETLEAMARALFKSWFVDFNPVHEKIEGHNPGLPKPIRVTDHADGQSRDDANVFRKKWIWVRSYIYCALPRHPSGRTGGQYFGATVTGCIKSFSIHGFAHLGTNFSATGRFCRSAMLQNKEVRRRLLRPNTFQSRFRSHRGE